MQQLDALDLTLNVLDRALCRCRTLVCGLHYQLTVLPGTIREVREPYQLSAGLLIAVQCLQVFRIVVFRLVVRCVGVLTYHEVRHTHSVQCCSLWSVLCGVLSRYRGHDVVILVLSDHLVSVVHLQQVVIEGLFKRIVCLPGLEAVDIQVAFRTVERYRRLVSCQASSCIFAGSDLLTVEVHLYHADTSVWCHCHRLDDDSHVCSLSVLERCRYRLSHRLAVVGSKYHVLTVHVEAEAVGDT